MVNRFSKLNLKKSKYLGLYYKNLQKGRLNEILIRFFSDRK